MFFKNIRLFALTETFPYSQDELETQLGNQLFAPCSKFEKSRLGWVARWVTTLRCQRTKTLRPCLLTLSVISLWYARRNRIGCCPLCGATGD